MADHLWFVPAVGSGTGGGIVSQAPGQEALNLDYATFVYPASEAATLSIRIVNAASIGGGGNAAAALTSAYAAFLWRNSGNSSCNAIAASLKLLVGTVFASDLGTEIVQDQLDEWNSIDVWAKYVVNDVNKLDGVFLSINDSSGNIESSSNYLPSTTNDIWRVVHHTIDVSESELSVLSNLRAVLTFVGQDTFSAGALGDVTVGVEWIAIRLRDQKIVEP